MHINTRHPAHKAQERAYIVHPDITANGKSRDIEDILEEAEGLARAIDLDVLETVVLKVGDIQPGAFFGKGQREKVKSEVSALEPDIIIVNGTLSPVQQRNLEKEWHCKVIDRTGLILEIFGARAQTKEGRLQVDLAALEYQRSRLVRSWTHLERQRGGAGFMGGPGERQIEIDRRLIDQRILRCKKELEDVRRTRDLGRQNRARVPYPVIALVGYTNAGKSTLFNTITHAGVFAEDLPFATLDPTLRRIKLPNNQDAILSDTVGFIADLPTHLVAAFRATLEQTVHADVIVHVIDVSRHDWQAQREDVIKILTDLGIEYESDARIIEAYNKVDALSEEELAALKRKAFGQDNIIMISALKNEGLDTLEQGFTDILAARHVEGTLTLPFADGRSLAWLYDHADILERTDKEEGIRLKMRIDLASLARFEKDTNYRVER